MLANSKEMRSPSRTYMAMCVSSKFDGYYFKKFTLPETVYMYGNNNAEYAAWYFLNELDGFACIEGCIPLEHYQHVKEVP